MTVMAITDDTDVLAVRQVGMLLDATSTTQRRKPIYCWSGSSTRTNELLQRKCNKDRNGCILAGEKTGVS